jgi:hypothetical protein
MRVPNPDLCYRLNTTTIRGRGQRSRSSPGTATAFPDLHNSPVIGLTLSSSSHVEFSSPTKKHSQPVLPTAPSCRAHPVTACRRQSLVSILASFTLGEPLRASALRWQQSLVRRECPHQARKHICPRAADPQHLPRHPTTAAPARTRSTPARFS